MPFHMVHYKFYYFPTRGRGDFIRQIFKLAGVKFENEVVSIETWFTHFKKEMPMGQLPVLEVDGHKIAQSLAIARFLGHQFDRTGKNPIECARLDMIADYVQEMTTRPEFGQWGQMLMGMIEGDKEAHFKEKVMPVVEQYAPTVEKFLVENGNNLFIGDKETWVDIFVAEMFSKLQDFGSKDALSAYPHIQQLINRIHNIPAIQEHIKHRPSYSA